MSTNPKKLSRAGSGRPCMCCQEATKGCSWPSDDFAICRGEPGSDWEYVKTDAAGFRNYRRRTTSRSPGKPAIAKPATQSRWETDAKKYASQLTAARKATLAKSISLPVESLETVSLLGYSTQYKGCLTIPERDGTGAVIGIATRNLQGEKKFIKDGKRGLTLPAGWIDKPGPVLAVEGGSSTIACSHAGLACVGRPSNVGGATFLAEVLAGIPSEREIIVVGDNDQKADGKWPGKDGRKVALSLSSKLGRPIKWAMPPSGTKDSRSWLTAADRGNKSFIERGQEYLTIIQAAAETVNKRKRSDAPEIEIDVDEHRVNHEAALALGSEADIYQRGGILVHVIETTTTEEPGVVRRAVGSPVVRELSPPILRERLTRCAAWVKPGRGDKTHPAHPPRWCINAVHARGQWPSVRQLEAVVSHPVLLSDGSISAADGYSTSSKLLTKLPAGLRCDVPEKPNQRDAAKAVATLFDVITDFPFETDAHRSAWLAGLLTPLAWFSFDGPAPLFLIDANTRGAGKGLLADVIAFIVSGRRFPVMNYTNDREELRKKITSLAVEGERLVMLDNLAGSVGNEILDAALTSDRWKDRLLGGNRIYDGPLHVAWFGTGNNVQLQGDTSRRICHIRMLTSEERPEFRDGFKYPNLRQHITANRSRLLSAALTILRAWVVAGRPSHGLPNWGSFEGWSGVVREAVVFAGLPDPGETRLALQAESDRDAQAMGVIISCLQQMDNDNEGVTAVDIIDQIRLPATPQPSWHSDLKSAVSELCGKLDSRTLGNKLRHFKHRNFGGLMVSNRGQDRNKVNRWAVVQASLTPQQPASDILEFPPDMDLACLEGAGSAG